MGIIFFNTCTLGKLFVLHILIIILFDLFLFFCCLYLIVIQLTILHIYACYTYIILYYASYPINLKAYYFNLRETGQRLLHWIIDYVQDRLSYRIVQRGTVDTIITMGN